MGTAEAEEHEPNHSAAARGLWLRRGGVGCCVLRELLLGYQCDERTQEVRCQVPGAVRASWSQARDRVQLCAARAPEHARELPCVMLQTIITGLMYPKLAAAFCHLGPRPRRV